MRQRRLAEEGYEKFRKPNCGERFLKEVEEVIPWAGSCGVIEPFYPKGDCAGRTAVIRKVAPYAQDFTHHRGHRHQPLSAEERAKNRTKSRARAKGEHPFLILKRLFGFAKVRYRGICKNANRLLVACGLVNLYMARRVLLRPT